MKGSPLTGTEKQILHTELQRQRDVVRWKLVGLNDEQLRRSMTPSGTNLLGLVKHLASVEYGWFCGTFGRESFELAQDPDDDNADMHAAPGESTADILAYYDRALLAADQSIDQLDIADSGTAWFGEKVSLRWVLVHMIIETARHAGHLDITRELIDGSTGDYPPVDA